MRTLLCFLLSGGAWLWAADKPAAPRVEALYPSSPTLPANHLKFYIHFSEPMRQGVFLEHCRLLDDHGRAVSEPFRETELWSEDGRRLTLWLHPGRQKTGVNLNTQLGPVLAPGMRCSLVILGAWPSVNGALLGNDTEKAFFTGPRETKQLDINGWKITPPKAGSTQPVEIQFPTPLDHALLLRCVQVVDDAKKPVQGTITTFHAERGWRFTPEKPWTDQEHHVVVNAILEDLAGNSLARPFEVNLEDSPTPKVPPTLELPFRASVSNQK